MTLSRWMVLAACTLALAAIAVREIGGTVVTKDAAQNLQMAINVAHHGVLSLSDKPPYEASMYREPLPVAASALMVGLVDRLLGPAEPGEYFSGKRVQLVKYQNLPWLLLLWAAALATLLAFTDAFYLCVVGAVLIVKPFLSADIAGVDNLYTELPATALLACASLLLVLALRGRRAGLFAATGAVFGLVTLTKGAILYVFACLIVGVLLAGLRRAPRPARAAEASSRGPDGPARHLLHVLAMSAAFAVVVLPWVARNVQLFGQAQVSERGGLAVYTRALMNGMSSVEYRGTFYAWARPALQPSLGALLGFSPADLRLGGRLQRLALAADSDTYSVDLAAERDAKPELAITDYRRGRAERKRLTRHYEHDGVAYPDVAADATLSHEGMTMIRQNVAADLALALPLLWRSAPVLFPAIWLGIALGLRTRNDALTLYLLPGAAYLCFYALITPFEARPALLAEPFAVTALVAVALAVWHRARANSTR